MNDYNFGNFLCMLRESKGMTQADVASILGVTPAAVSKWENGSSKPRVEILFKLSEILGVRVEELMAGHHIESNTLNPTVVKEINERYEYLRKVDSHNTASVKFKRILAFLIDWNIIGTIVLLLGLSLVFIFERSLEAGNPWVIILLFLVMLLFPVLVILRDIVFGGRSLGKRITGLVILDKKNGELAATGKRLIRNLFLIIFQYDAIVLLISGASIGDRVGGTVVIPKKVYEASEGDETAVEIDRINNYEAPKVNIKKTILIVALCVVLVISILVGIIYFVFELKKNSKEYKISYDYLVSSSSFKGIEADESDIRMNSYSVNSYSSISNPDKIQATSEIGFVVNGHPFTVVCHYESGKWVICEDCTHFN